MKIKKYIYYIFTIISLKVIYKLFNMSNTTNIYKNIYIGNFISSLYSNEFDIIINTTKELPFFYNKKNIRIPINDNIFFKNNNILKYIDKILNSYDINKKILIHCKFGLQRSCFVTQILLLKIFKIRLIDSYKLIKKKRLLSFLPLNNFKFIYKDLMFL